MKNKLLFLTFGKMSTVIFLLFLFGKISSSELFAQSDCPPNMSTWVCDPVKTSDIEIRLPQDFDSNHPEITQCHIICKYQYERCIDNAGNVTFNIFSINFKFVDVNLNGSCKAMEEYLQENISRYDANKLHKIEIFLLQQIALETFLGELPGPIVTIRKVWAACFAYTRDNNAEWVRVNCGGEQICCYKITYGFPDHYPVPDVKIDTNTSAGFCPGQLSPYPPDMVVTDCVRYCE